jgi:Sec-independent protein translocase protein TatA
MEIPILLAIVLIVVIVWRGPKTLPLLGKAFGQGVREARKEINELRADDGSDASDEGSKGA